MEDGWEATLGKPHGGADPANMALGQSHQLSLWVAAFEAYRGRKLAPFKKWTPLHKWVLAGLWHQLASRPLPQMGLVVHHVLVVNDSFTKWVEAFP